MINGLPGVGKTTAGVSLAAAMSAPFLSKDSVKEQLAETETDLPGSHLGAIASELMWSQAAELNGMVVVESWWYRIRDTQHAVNGLRRSGANRGVEVWCTAPEHIIRQRYRQRSRHEIHRDRERLNTDWEGWAVNAGPLSITPVVVLDTSTEVSITDLVEDVVSALSASSLHPGH
ncbi:MULTISPECIES: AAA family ATPase [Mycobacteriaceae]|uniref:Predicted kinase n=1 Tax=Mycolicibacterium fluoranthenivorans TaxID=258505 RepID=A0A1G4VAJ6_9MYCO|nr:MULTISPECIES: AAA family ATPase [Mycobacteriaceae]SCX03717.1 Predicted kinase [Mycolicibacterium fluoranthenivorans]